MYIVTGQRQKNKESPVVIFMIQNCKKTESRDYTKPQVDKMCSKLASGCWALYQLKPHVNSVALMMIYYSFIL